MNDEFFTLSIRNVRDAYYGARSILEHAEEVIHGLAADDFSRIEGWHLRKLVDLHYANSGVIDEIQSKLIPVKPVKYWEMDCANAFATTARIFNRILKCFEVESEQTVNPDWFGFDKDVVNEHLVDMLGEYLDAVEGLGYGAVPASSPIGDLQELRDLRKRERDLRGDSAWERIPDFLLSQLEEEYIFARRAISKAIGVPDYWGATFADSQTNEGYLGITYQGPFVSRSGFAEKVDTSNLSRGQSLMWWLWTNGEKGVPVNKILEEVWGEDSKANRDSADKATQVLNIALLDIRIKVLKEKGIWKLAEIPNRKSNSDTAKKK